MQTTLLEAALGYARRRWRIFPLHYIRPDGLCSCGEGSACHSPGKHPLTRNGVKDASSDPETVRAWWTLHPDANIGLACGGDREHVVLDLDGPEALSALEAAFGGPLPPTLRVTTGRGEHLHFYGGVGIRNKVKILPEVDVRAEGGYVLLPPSNHKSGNLYHFVDGPDTPEIMPPALRELFVEKPRETPPPKPRDNGLLLRVKGQRTLAPGEIHPYAAKALEDAVEAVERAPIGERNNTLNKEAYSLGGLVANPDAGLSRETVESHLMAAARQAGLGEIESRKTIQSGLTSGMSALREIPEREATWTDAGAGWGGTPPPPMSAQPPGWIGPGGVYDKDFMTDSGNARRLVYVAEGQIRYCGTWKKWLAWDGARWVEDWGGLVQRHARAAALSFFEDSAEVIKRARAKEGATEEDLEKATKRAQEIFAWAKTSLSAAKREAMVKLAASEPRVSIHHEELDTDPWLFNVQNGTIDLRTGALLPHQREQLITRISPVAYDPTAECPTFLAFLDKIMSGKEEMVSGIQRAVGYSLSGSVREQVLFFLHGGGSNGKSTLIEAILYILGEYGYVAPPGLLLVKKGGGESHPTEQAGLFGKRFAACQEVKKGARWDEEVLKRLTGQDRITARRMREDFWEFNPTHKLWISGNHKPRVHGADHAIWRRIKLIPFSVTISEEEKDKELPAKLRNEAPGILAWAVRGCLAWQKEGLAFPQEVEEATKRYREGEDVVGRFFEDRCTFDKGAQVTTKDLYSAYLEWCEQEGEHPISKRAMAERLEERGLTPHKGTGGQRGWLGIALAPVTPPAPPASGTILRVK